MLQLIEIEVFKNLLNKYKPEKVLEWGAGGSTIHFSQLSFIKSWTAIDDNWKWVSKVMNEVGVENGKVKVFHAESWDRYVQIPKLLGLDPDFVVVDGRERVACLREVYRLVRPGIPVLLHDHRRSRYKEGINLFEHQEILVGSISSDKPNTVDKEKSADGLYWHQGLLLMFKGSK